MRDNNLQDAGVRYICAGVAEQTHGLLTLNLTSNNIGQEGFHNVSAMLVRGGTVEDFIARDLGFVNYWKEENDVRVILA